MKLVKTSYTDGVEMLLKDLTGQIEGKTTEEREKLIQSGVSYSEMVPIEQKPSDAYMELYNKATKMFKSRVAKAVMTLCEKLYALKGSNIVLVSLARAGTPIGILMKDYFRVVHNLDIPHYSISIIRGVGIDENAMNYICSRHNAEDITFVDGWTGKGAILTELRKAVQGFTGVSSELAVVADPANLCTLCGTKEDLLIPSSCLNSITHGLVSRSIYNKELIHVENGDYHGAIYYDNLEEHDISNKVITDIAYYWRCEKPVFDKEHKEILGTGLDDVKEIQKEFGITDINFIKPGIGETTRVLLRRVPWKLLVKDLNDKDNIGHILELAEEKQVEVIEYNKLKHYRCVGIIKSMRDI